MTGIETFTPFWASPPGRTIQTALDELGLDISDFASEMDFSITTADNLLKGRETISLEMARRLAHLLGPSVEFWVSRDCQYREDLARVDTDRWLSDLPVKEMVKLGWIAPASDWASQVNACLSFFGVENVSTWRKLYEPQLEATRMRISSSVPSRPLVIATWMRRATREAESATLDPWNASRIRETIPLLKKLTRQKDPKIFIPRLRSYLKASGVALVVLRAISGCPASGAARFLSPDRAMIVVSGRFLADDQFWFTVMHEIGHLLLHSPEQTILDDPYSYDSVESREEMEANRFAAETLFPASIRAQLPAQKPTPREVIGMALAAGVAPGIVVGQLQFENRIERDHMNKLKRRYKWNGPSLEIA